MWRRQVTDLHVCSEAAFAQSGLEAESVEWNREVHSPGQIDAHHGVLGIQRFECRPGCCIGSVDDGSRGAVLADVARCRCHPPAVEIDRRETYLPAAVD